MTVKSDTVVCTLILELNPTFQPRRQDPAQGLPLIRWQSHTHRDWHLGVFPAVMAPAHTHVRGFHALSHSMPLEWAGRPGNVDFLAMLVLQPTRGLIQGTSRQALMNLG